MTLIVEQILKPAFAESASAVGKPTSIWHTCKPLLFEVDPWVGALGGITLVSEVVSPPKGILQINIRAMATSISHWFDKTELPRPSYVPEASTGSVHLIQSQIDSWVGDMIVITDRQTERHRSNLNSVQLELYRCTITQRKQAHSTQIIGKLLVKSFGEVAELCNTHGFQSLERILLKERALFRRAILVHLAMIEGLERTTNSWRIRCFESASAFLDAVRSSY